MSQCVSIASRKPPVLQCGSLLLQSSVSIHSYIEFACLLQVPPRQILTQPHNEFLLLQDKPPGLQWGCSRLKWEPPVLQGDPQCSKNSLSSLGWAFMIYWVSIAPWWTSTSPRWASTVLLQGYSICSSTSFQRSGWASIALWRFHMDLEWGQGDFGSIMFHFQTPRIAFQA